MEEKEKKFIHLANHDQILISKRKYCFTGFLTSWGRANLLLMEGASAGYAIGLMIIHSGAYPGMWLFIPASALGLFSSMTLPFTLSMSDFSEKIEIVRDKFITGVEGSYLLSLTIADIIHYIRKQQLSYIVHIPVTIISVLTTSVVTYFSPHHNSEKNKSLLDCSLIAKIAGGAIITAISPAGMMDILVDNLELMPREVAFYTTIGLFLGGAARELCRPRLPDKANSIIDFMIKAPKYASIASIFMLMINNVYVLATQGEDIPDAHFYIFSLVPSVFLFALQIVFHLLICLNKDDTNSLNTESNNKEKKSTKIGDLVKQFKSPIANNTSSAASSKTTALLNDKTYNIKFYH